MNAWRLLGLATLAGCATLSAAMHQPSPNDRYNAMCNSWVNSNVSDVIVSWGQPTQTSRLPDGTLMYEWDQVEGANMTPDRVDHFSRAQERGSAWCSTRFVTGANGVITTYSWNGNNYNDGTNFRIGCYTTYQPPAPPQPPPAAPATTTASSP